MADAKQPSSPSLSGDRSLAPTASTYTMEEITASVTVSGGENTSSEESEETPEARVLAQGMCGHSTQPLYYHLYMTLVEFYFADTNLPYDKSVLVRYQESNRIDSV